MTGRVVRAESYELAVDVGKDYYPVGRIGDTTLPQPERGNEKALFYFI